MPITGFRCTKEKITGRTECTFEQCKASCLAGAGCHPPSYIFNILQNVWAYTNNDTISGSGLAPECDTKLVLERTTDYLIEPPDLHWAAFRGALVHQSLENFKSTSEAKNWIIERRYYAAILPKGWEKNKDLKHLKPPIPGVPIVPIEHRDLSLFRHLGCVNISGQMDAVDVPSKILYDYKTAKWIYETDEAKFGHQVQTRTYAFLLWLHNVVKVERIIISTMDAAWENSQEVEVGDLKKFMLEYVIPESRRQLDLREARLKPNPQPNFLCIPKKKDAKVYCRVKDACGYWTDLSGKKAEVKWVERNDVQLVDYKDCYGCLYYVAKDARGADGSSGKCPDRCPNIVQTNTKVK